MNLNKRLAEPAEDDCETRRVEVEFAFPVYLTESDFCALYELIDSIVRRPVNQLEDGIHWLAEHGHKPKWSVADCRILGKMADFDAPESGEPSFDPTISYMATAARGFVTKAEEDKYRAKRASLTSSPSTQPQASVSEPLGDQPSSLSRNTGQEEWTLDTVFKLCRNDISEMGAHRIMDAHNASLTGQEKKEEQKA